MTLFNRDRNNGIGNNFISIVNDDFATALNDLEAIVTAQRLRTVKQQMRHQVLMDELLGSA